MKETVVRLHIDDGHATFGTGVFIRGDLILTARHVIDPDGKSLNGHFPKSDAVTVESTYWMGKREADDLVFLRNEVDLGLVILKQPKSIDLEKCAAVHAEPHKVINVGDEATVYGFNAANLDVQTVTIRVIAIDGNTGAYVCDKALPGGFSGGPVFAGGGLVGIAFAQHFQQGQSYFYGGHALLDAVHSQGGSIKWITLGVTSHLREYPKGPAVTSNEVHMELHLVMDAYIRLYSGAHAQSFLGRANAERLKCDPSAVTNGIIEIAHLPNVNIDPMGFWYGAFVQAGLKSPRMLAALLLESNPDSFTDDERNQRNQFLEKLKRWKQAKN